MWNMPYHTEHDAYFAVPFHSLPALSKELKNDLVNIESHRNFHRNAIKELVSKKS